MQEEVEVLEVALHYVVCIMEQRKEQRKRGVGVLGILDHIPKSRTQTNEQGLGRADRKHFRITRLGASLKQRRGELTLPGKACLLLNH